MALAGVVAAAAAACGAGAEDRAAARAVDACIAALEPVADDRRPSPAVLEEALADAEDAARTDAQWEALAAALRRAVDTAGTPEGDAAVATLVQECRRSRDRVRRGGQDPREASGFPDGGQHRT